MTEATCDCCGNPGGECPYCGAMHSPAIANGCESCKDDERNLLDLIKNMPKPEPNHSTRRITKDGLSLSGIPRRMYESLTDKEKEVLELRFATPESTAYVDATTERIRAIEEKARQKLRRLAEEREGGEE